MSTLEFSQTMPVFSFGFALTFNLEQVLRYVNEGIGSNPAAPFNSFSHARTLAGPDDTFVTINNDTLYSMAQLDLSVGPVKLTVPATNGRYYVLQFVDAWTNNFAYVGHRATGTEAGEFLIVPPGWTGEAPDGIPVIQAPTNVASIVGRWACDGDEDLPAVHALQDAAKLEPLDPQAVPAGIPALDPRAPKELEFLEKFRLWSQAFPPADRDKPVLASFADYGVTTPGPTPYANYSAERVTELATAFTGDFEAITALLKSGFNEVQNGWQLTYHAFDYNIDFFEIGAKNEPLFTSLPENLRYVLRAGAAIGGLWGNHSYEAAYSPVYVDSNGEQLNGSRTYTLTLNPPPPVGAFWSITMYDMPDYFLVRNPIDRYSLGDRTDGIVFNQDGSLTIAFSHTEPTDPVLRANWLPSPEGDFRPLIRMYEPEPQVITGGYELPPIVRTS